MMADKAAQWGADQELKACCDHIRDYQWGFVDRPNGTQVHRAVDLELARRPKPVSLKEEALSKLEQMEKLWESMGHNPDNTIRRALESLDD